MLLATIGLTGHADVRLGHSYRLPPRSCIDFGGLVRFTLAPSIIIVTAIYKTFHEMYGPYLLHHEKQQHACNNNSSSSNHNNNKS